MFDTLGLLSIITSIPHMKNAIVQLGCLVKLMIQASYQYRSDIYGISSRGISSRTPRLTNIL